MRKNINIGSIEMHMNENGNHELKRICSCGHKSIGEYLTTRDVPTIHECEECGSRNFTNRGKFPSNHRKAMPTLFDIESSSRGFEFKKTNLSVVFHSDNETIEVIQPNMIRKYVFDWVDSILKVYRNEELEYDLSWEGSYEKDEAFARVGRYLSTGMSDKEELIASLNLENSAFYNYISRALNEDGRGYYPRKRNFLAVLRDALGEKVKYNWIQILCSAGYADFGHHNSYLIRDTIDKSATKPHKILGVPKKMARIIKESQKVDFYMIKNIQDMHQDGGRMKYLYSIIDNLPDKSKFSTLMSNVEDIVMLVAQYSYSPKALIEYLFEEIYLYQGIDSVRDGVGLLRDYINMAREMSIPFEKYPRSLKREHDVMTINHRVFMRDKEVEDFSEAMAQNDYLIDMSSDKDYCILLPETSQDLVVEGGKLNHCVGSYVNSVKKGKTVIAFLREKENIDTPLVTIEVKGYRVSQARGSHNRGLVKKEKDYIKKWAEERQLHYV